jgi:arginase
MYEQARQWKAGTSASSGCEGACFATSSFNVILRQYAVIEAPSILGLKPTGVDRLSQRVLENGLATRIHARRAGRVEPPLYMGIRDPDAQTNDARAISTWTPRLADAIERVVDAGDFPLILGGDCSILLGAALAFRRRGRFGLLFVDGHADYYQPEANPNGEAASMDLALATGRGPALLTEIEGRAPLVRPEDVVAFGFRDAEEQRQYGSQPLPDEMLAIDLPAIRSTGIEPAIDRALDRLSASTIEGFFIHVDADCLDDGIMPAVDYRLPGGFSWDELTLVIRRAIGSGRAVGLELTIYNPALDDDGAAGRGLTDMLCAALAMSAPWRET